MPQINLLKQSSTTSHIMRGSLNGVLVKILAVVLVGVLGWYAWMFFETSKISASNDALAIQISQEQNQLKNFTNRSEILTRQAQLQQFNTLVENHIYWSNLFPELARVTLQGADYTALNATNDGTINVSVAVPNLVDLDNFLQVFDLTDINKSFSNLTIGSVSQDSITNTVRVDVKFNFDTGLLQYHTGN